MLLTHDARKTEYGNDNLSVVSKNGVSINSNFVTIKGCECSFFIEAKSILNSRAYNHFTTLIKVNMQSEMGKVTFTALRH